MSTEQAWEDEWTNPVCRPEARQRSTANEGQCFETIGDNELPSTVDPVDVGAAVVDIASFYQHSCTVLDTNAVRCWGRNIDGQLGYGNTTIIGDTETPASAGNVEFL